MPFTRCDDLLPKGASDKQTHFEIRTYNPLIFSVEDSTSGQFTQKVSFEKRIPGSTGLQDAYPDLTQMTYTCPL